MGFEEFDETIFIGISVSFGVNVGVVGAPRVRNLLIGLRGINAESLTAPCLVVKLLSLRFDTRLCVLECARIIYYLRVLNN